MDKTLTKPWTCHHCGRQLAVTECTHDRKVRLLFDSDMLPSLVRDAPGFIEVECPRCGEVRKWYKMLDERMDS
jgi:phage FluMu protein Com